MNARCKINTYGQKFSLDVSYETIKGKRGFLSILKLGNDKYYGKEMLNKKDAEEEAAKSALLNLEIKEDWYPRAAELFKCPDRESLSIIFEDKIKSCEGHEYEKLKLIGESILHLYSNLEDKHFDKGDRFIGKLNRKISWDNILRLIAVVYLRTNINNSFTLINLIFLY